MAACSSGPSVASVHTFRSVGAPHWASAARSCQGSATCHTVSPAPRTDRVIRVLPPPCQCCARGRSSGRRPAYARLRGPGLRPSLNQALGARDRRRFQRCRARVHPSWTWASRSHQGRARPHGWTTSAGMPGSGPRGPRGPPNGPLAASKSVAPIWLQQVAAAESGARAHARAGSGYAACAATPVRQPRWQLRMSRRRNVPTPVCLRYTGVEPNVERLSVA